MGRSGLYLLWFGIVVLWGWSFVAVKDAVDDFSAAGFLAVRFALAVGLLVPFAMGRWNRATVLVGVALGLVLACSYLFQTFGLAHTRATNSGVITGLFIVFVPLINKVFFGVRTRTLAWVAVGVSVVGLALLAGAAPDGLVLGDVLTLCCAVFYGAYVVLVDRFAKDHDAIALVTIQLATVSIVSGAVWCASGPISMPPSSVWTVLVIMAVIGSAGAFYVQTLVQQSLSAIQTASILMLEPVFAGVFAWWLHGDRLTQTQWVGAFLMFGAVLVAHCGSREEKGMVEPCPQAS